MAYGDDNAIQPTLFFDEQSCSAAFMSNSIQTPWITERMLAGSSQQSQARRGTMRASLFIIAAAAALAATVPASSVSAQGVTVEGPAGVGVRVGEPDRYHERRGEGRREGRRGDRREGRYDRDRATVGDGCRTVISKSRSPDGTVVIRKRSSC
jgi:hypothetical protein